MENLEEVLVRDVIVGSNWLLDARLFGCVACRKLPGYLLNHVKVKQLF